MTDTKIDPPAPSPKDERRGNHPTTKQDPANAGPPEDPASPPSPWRSVGVVVVTLLLGALAMTTILHLYDNRPTDLPSLNRGHLAAIATAMAVFSLGLLGVVAVSDVVASLLRPDGKRRSNAIKLLGLGSLSVVFLVIALIAVMPR